MSGLAGTMPATLCVFRHGGADYAIDVALAGEVVPMQAPTPVPRCPDGVLGLINLRGQPLAVVDPAALLGLPAHADSGGLRHLLVIRTDVRLAGLPIQSCEGIFAAAPNGFRAPAPVGKPTWVAGFQSFPNRPGLVATIIDGQDLLARLASLRFHRHAH